MEATPEHIYWTILNYNHWKLYIAATCRGLCYVGSQNKDFEELSSWTKKRFPGSILVEDEHKLEPFRRELIEYLNGERKAFTIPIDFHGTAFQQSVWNALCAVPYGATQSYSDIAEFIQNPSAVRAVGSAIGANPILIAIPCHRIVGKNGKLTGYRGGLDMKTQLLELEKVK